MAKGLPRAVALSGDIADVAQAAVSLAQERFGGVDIVVNNAAIIRDGFIFKLDPRPGMRCCAPTSPAQSGCSLLRPQ